MSVNTSHTPDGRGVILYNGEIILIYSKEVALQFDGLHPVFEGRKNCRLYLTSHRIIFTNNDGGDRLLSFSIPFQALREVKMRHPLVGATYLKGQVLAQPNGNWTGDATFKLTFYAGSCIEFGEALLKAAKLATQHHAMYAPPPPYTPPPSNYFSAPPASYTGQDYGLNIPINAFPDHPAAGTVYMYESPPPYAGIPPPIHRLPNELLVKIIDKLPRTQWTDLELIDHKFQDAVFLAWGSVREVDIERDFIYSETEVSEDEGDHDYGEDEVEMSEDESDDDSAEDEVDMVKGRLRHQIAQKTEAILKKLSKRSPFITSLSGLSLITGDPTLNTTAVQYLSRFKHLETIKFARKCFSALIVPRWEVKIICDIPLINFVEFLESTRSRATLKEIDIGRCDLVDDATIDANIDHRLRAAFANDTNDPTRQLLQLESFSMQMFGGNYPLTFLDGVNASRMRKLSLGDSHVEPAALTTLVNGASRLQHIDFSFLDSCEEYDNTPICQGGRLQPNKELLAALESHPNLTSLRFSRIWDNDDCACHRFEDEFKKMLRTTAPRLLNFVFMPGFFPPGIRMGEIRDIIQHHMPKLKSITLDADCAKYPEELRGIADIKELEEIEIAVFYPNALFDDYKAILNEVMSTIIDRSPRLKRLIGVGFHPDQRVVVELFKLGDLIDLRIGADLLTKENFVTFSHQVFAKKMQVLHVGSIGEGVESGLIELIKKAAQLREFMVNRNVTDRLLECLAESCPNLEKFRALSANGITIDGVQLLVDRCPNLRWLFVNNKDGTLARSLKNLKLARYRKLELEF